MPIAIQQPTLTLKFGVMTTGIFPFRGGGDGASIGIGHYRIFGFDFVPSRGAADTGGQLFAISQNTALFSILGTTYGGDGRTTFGIPNLGSRVAVSVGQGPGLSDYQLGEISGLDSINLSQANLPTTRGGASAGIFTVEESLAVNYTINAFGLFPGGSAGLGFIGQINAFAGNFEPNGQLFCDGRLLNIAEYDTLFAVIGTTYGGDGVNTFALPDLRGRAPVGQGNGVVLGQAFGTESVSLTTANLPVAMGGSGVPVSNYGPSLGITYLVAIQGVFPSRDGGLTGDVGDDPMIGEIIMYAGGSFIPNGYVRAEGQLLPIAQNQALFALYGTRFGGDGVNNFALPDMRGRAAADDTAGQPVGTVLGQAATTLTISDFPAVSLNGDGSNNSYFGANQADILNGNGGDDTLVGNGGDDILNGGTGNDSMAGGVGNDIYIVDSASDVVSEAGGNGIDRVEASGPSFVLPTGVENLEYTGAGSFTGTGNDLANIITGGVQGDSLSGGAGDDNVGGEAGDDVLNGDAGNDRLVGGSGADTMNGGADNDTLVVDNAGDVANGGTGTDTVEIVASLSNYAIAGDVENITLRAASSVIGNALDNLFGGSAGDDGFLAGDGSDTAYGRAGNDSLSGENGNDRLYGEAGNDMLSGGSGTDSLYGGADNDSLNGGADADTLYGEGGIDSLTGGAGRDMLYGGAGSDTFIFDDGESGNNAATADRIMDFTAGDKIDLSAIDASTVNSANPFTFVGTAAFSNTAGELRYQFVGAETYIYGDTNGDGIADVVIRVQGNIALTAGDFTL